MQGIFAPLWYFPVSNRLTLSVLIHSGLTLTVWSTKSYLKSLWSLSLASPSSKSWSRSLSKSNRRIRSKNSVYRKFCGHISCHWLTVLLTKVEANSSREVMTGRARFGTPTPAKSCSHLTSTPTSSTLWLSTIHSGKFAFTLFAFCL